MLISNGYASALVAALYASLGWGQELKEQVWGVFAFTLHGDSVPAVMPRPPALTPYGARELYTAGSAFRSRYVAIQSSNNGPSTRIESLSPYAIDPGDIDVLSTTKPSDIASAQAFMQGLYPPLNESYSGTYVDSSYRLANGSVAAAPLRGYQYPQIVTVSSEDPRSITVDGQSACLIHHVANSEYKSSLEVQEIVQTSEGFYTNLYDQALSGVLDRSSANYRNAELISEFLDYQSVHNETLLHHLNQGDIDRARSFADQYIFATNGNTTSSSAIENSTIRTIAGRTLASSILDAFDKNVNLQGTEGMMTLMFGGYEPVVALTSLLRLALPQHNNFYSRPIPGGSIVLELFSLTNEANPTFPGPSQLYVRFLLRNGTDSPEFQSYPLFGHSPSNDAVPYTEFQAELGKFSLGSIQQWCLQCASEAVFCSGVMDVEHNASTSKKGLNPAVAGVIGAVVTLVALAVLAITGFSYFGFHFNRLRISGLRGFKGSNKMASDPDISFKNPTWEDVKPVTNQDPHTPGARGAMVRGHERLGSWELQDHNGNDHTSQGRREGVVSPFDNDSEAEWRTHSALKPVAPRESV
ncbi:hypothetical protein EYZ11_005206 [Aspergillus tanneri]|uniref:Histidine acid phosphatase n=1 Tax=Aspergillus tanneri TaxID=1220188 RepID=A0A4S3JIG0_9EURO|nr:uncharacterized protein ATNIH1004_001400 [Aspergillus tanneri]KAA8652496.1 hypothetical protein ATNIH1004_001400 [Aspergillus tanneri]THC95296.1 hypothetical protein EYZ11_005206 [Aspergillus tanneri]